MSKDENGFKDSDHYLFSIEFPGDSAPIRGRSIIDLYRAYAINSFVAFVGSGTSVALGYPTWGGFARDLGGHLREQADAPAQQSCEDRDAAYRKKLVEAVKHYESKLLAAASNDPSDLSDMLSLSSELAELIDSSSSKARGADDVGTVADGGSAVASEAAGGKPRGTDVGLAEFYRRKFLTRSRRIARVDVDDAPSPVPQSDGARRAAAQRLHRMLVKVYEDHAPVFFAHGDGSKRSLPADYVAGEQLLRRLSGTQTPVQELYPDKPDVLLDELRPSLDVLSCLRGDWHVSRFVTLNYDHEIERQLEDHTFPYFSLVPRAVGDGEKPTAPAYEPVPLAHAASARSRLGERALSVDLCPENIAELLLFAANFSSARVQVLHLHGSVRDPATMIVTDRDYNRRYYAGGGWPSVLTDGQELLFRGNGIVFVGVGMNEDELLRPLRILAQAPGRESRPAFALLPTSGEHKDTATAIKLYQRYGIRSIFYGTRLGTDGEFGNLREHPLFVDFLRRVGSDTPVEVSDLASLDGERHFLGLLRDLIRSRRGVADGKSADGEEARLLEAIHRELGTRGDCDDWWDTKTVAPQRLPRLLLTPWHADIFALVLACIGDREIAGIVEEGGLDVLENAVDALESAIVTRALVDALRFLAHRANGWRQRWTRFPGHDHIARHNGRATSAPAFRRLPERPRLQRLVRRHICAPVELPPQALFHEFVSSDGLNDGTIAREILRAAAPVVCCLWSTGKGKGYVSSVLAQLTEEDRKANRHRVVISFSQSCEFDSCFDLIAEAVLFARKNAGSSVDCVLVQADLVFSKKTRIPKLAEWDAVLRMLIAAAKKEERRIRVVVLCEYPETRDYFRSVAGLKYCASYRSPELLKSPTTASAAISYIATRCKSRWLVLFLTRLIEYVERCEKAPAVPLSDTTTPGAKKAMNPRLVVKGDPQTFRERLVNDVCARLRQVQDPRQRIAAVIDVAMTNFERHVIAWGNRDARLQKIVAFAVMRHLFALGTPTRSELIEHFPEIRDILFSFGEKDNAKALIGSAVELLVEVCLAVRIYRHTEDGNYRLGLHGRTRNYLTSKKSLPFTRVEGREQAALTVLPVLAEEAIPLDVDDFQFLERLFESLVEAGRSYAPHEQVLAAECVRSAFGLLRGSMRIGVVLRATPAALKPGERSPLDNYFRRLLQIRLAALRLAEGERPASPSWPLYEREWVWLFNEMGVVRLLQGDMHDATTLLEQAVNFEESRLARGAGYEQLIYADRKQRRFSVSRLRIFINLCAAALERGSFERVTRIVERDLVNLRKHLFGLAPPSVGSGSKRPVVNRLRLRPDTVVANDGPPRLPETPIADSSRQRPPELPEKAEIERVLGRSSIRAHRELQILVLVGELINARVKYLAGAIGTAEQWLRRNRRTVVELGVHGLTASFFKIYADVKVRKGDYVRAAKYLSIARTEAEASSRPDVVLGVMLAEAEQSRDLQPSNNALQLRHHLSRLRKIETEARRYGMAQIEATVCLVRARLYLGFGEYRSAREDVMTALTITTVNGLRVKRIAALIVMAALLATEDAEQASRKEALELLTTARAEAERMGYKLAAVNALELEIVLGRKGSIEDWATSRARVAADAPTASAAAS